MHNGIGLYSMEHTLSGMYSMEHTLVGSQGKEFLGGGPYRKLERFANTSRRSRPPQSGFASGGPKPAATSAVLRREGAGDTDSAHKLCASQCDMCSPRGGAQGYTWGGTGRF